MVKPTLAFALAVLTALPAVPPVRTMYNDAFARERAVRAAMNEDDADPSVLADLRAVVARYERVVRHYPASSYCDNALWQAAELELDAFVKFGQPQDKDAGLRLLRQLASMYPTSKLAAQVPAQLARWTAEPSQPPRVVEPPKPTVTEAPALPSSRAPAPRVTDARAVEGPRPIESHGADRNGLATIKEIRRLVLADAVRIVIELDAEVEFRQDRLSNPSRVFVDLAGTKAAAALAEQTVRFERDADVVRQVRIGRHPNNTTRVVLDSTGISSYSVYPLYGPYRLVIDCIRDTAALATSGTLGAGGAPSTTAAAPARSEAPGRREVRSPPTSTPPLRAHAVTPVWLRTAPGNVPQHTLLLAEARAAEVSASLPNVAAARATLPAAPTPSPPVPPATLPPARAAAAGTERGAGDTGPETDAGPKTDQGSTTDQAPGTKDQGPGRPGARNSNGGFSIARQLGLGVSRIVIDAGHGGHDPGAQARGVVEAELVLDVALRVEKLLKKVPGVEVVLTRRTDEFVALQERTAIANREGADLFLSIHANASPSAQVHGIETYFLNFATNLSAAAVAARENAASGQGMNALPDIVKAIALNNKLDESRDFATQIQHAMVERLRSSNKTIKDLGVKQAPFVVLIGASMPSVLAEIGFVTNAQEARLVKSNGYRQRIADALFEAIKKYQTSLKNTTVVASQQP